MLNTDMLGYEENTTAAALYYGADPMPHSGRRLPIPPGRHRSRRRLGGFDHILRTKRQCVCGREISPPSIRFKTAPTWISRDAAVKASLAG
jgi:hypothetical protein